MGLYAGQRDNRCPETVARLRECRGSATGAQSVRRAWNIVSVMAAGGVPQL